MSVSLVVIRLEIADDCEPPKIQYTVPGFRKTKDTRPKLSYAAVAGCSSERSDTQNQIIDKCEECRGNREFVEIIIESLYNETFNDGYANPDIENQEMLLSKKRRSTGEVKGADVPTDGAKDKNNKSQNNEPDQANSSREGSVTSNSSGSSSGKAASKEVYFKPICDEEGPGGGSRPGSGSMTRPKSHSPTFRASPTIHFYSGNPCVERTRGILHLYKDNQMTSLKDEVSRSELICMLAVPAKLTIHDISKFTAPVSENMEYTRIIRDVTPNQYMVLLKFKNQKFADEFYTTFNNTQYNTIEPDICHLIYVAQVEILKESEGPSLPVPGITELPNCPVCLERMDESVDGILTILCNHAFHMTCLAQWGDTSCPVCRYSQTPEESVDNRCMKCNAQESLWICLICGHVGCGRYTEQHAYRHFQETQHTYAMQLGNNTVWDYAGDNYVHRLVQNKGDGKLVEVDERGNYIQEEKLDSLTLEYTYLLTNQLESQRLYFEEKVKQIEQDANERLIQLQHNDCDYSNNASVSSSVISKLDLENVEKLETKFQKQTQETEAMNIRLSEINKEKHAAEKKCSHLHSRLTKALKELQEEQEINKSLRGNQEEWQKKVVKLETNVHDLTKDKEQEIQDLREQLRDVMFFLEAQKKLSDTTEVSQDEIKDSQIFVGASGTTSSPSGRRGRKKDR